MKFYFLCRNKNIIRNPMLSWLKFFFLLKLGGRISKKQGDRSFVEDKIHLMEKLMEKLING